MPVSEDLERERGWWDYLKEDSVSQIQWTPDKGGWVRARLDSITKWEYRKCGCAKHAQSIGERIIEKQIEEKNN